MRSWAWGFLGDLGFRVRGLRFEAAGLGCFVDTLRVLLAEVVWISGFDFDRMFSLLRRVGLLYGLGMSCQLLFNLVHHDRRKGLVLRVAGSAATHRGLFGSTGFM